jgi:hypothetical protein
VYLFFQQQHHAAFKMTQAALSLARVDIGIAPWPNHFSNNITSMTQHLHHATTKLPQQRHRHHDSGGLAHTSPSSNPTRRITTDQTREFEEYYSNQWPNSGTLLPTVLTSTRGEHIITTTLWDTMPNQLSYFLSCILF